MLIVCMMTSHYSTGRATPKCTDRHHSERRATSGVGYERVPLSSLREQTADVPQAFAQRVVLGEFLGIVGVDEVEPRIDQVL
jgi:hypothetical protein